MNFIYGLLTGIVVSIISCVMWFKVIKKPGGTSEATKRDIMAEAKEKHAEMMAKVEDYIKDKTEITNDEIQNFLGVSDASAERYLQELESQGKLKQVGKTGIKTYYQVVSG